MKRMHSKEELINSGNIFDETEKQAIENGADARVWLEINKVVEITEADKKNIEEAAIKLVGESPNITYFDASALGGTSKVKTDMPLIIAPL